MTTYTLQRAAAAAFVAFATLGSVLAQDATWEYKDIRNRPINTSSLRLDEEAREGWELKVINEDEADRTRSVMGRTLVNGKATDLGKEYKVIDTTLNGLAPKLTSLGDDSWEIVTLTQDGNDVTVAVGRDRQGRNLATRTRYEYRLSTLGRTGNISELGSLGLQGWEAVDVFVNNDEFFALIRKDRQPMRAARPEALQYRWARFSGSGLDRQLSNELRGGWTLVGIAPTRTGNYEGLIMKSRQPGVGGGNSYTIVEFRDNRDRDIADDLNKQGAKGYELLKLYSDRFGAKALMRK